MADRGLAEMYAAEQGVGLAPTQQVAPATSAPVPTVEELVALLKQGVTPQELVQQGVPPELIEQAIAILQQEVQTRQPQGQPVQGGLAKMYRAEGAV